MKKVIFGKAESQRWKERFEQKWKSKEDCLIESKINIEWEQKDLCVIDNVQSQCLLKVYCKLVSFII